MSRFLERKNQLAFLLRGNAAEHRVFFRRLRDFFLAVKQGRVNIVFGIVDPRVLCRRADGDRIVPGYYLNLNTLFIKILKGCLCCWAYRIFKHNQGNRADRFQDVVAVKA